MLSIIETADDSSGEAYINGKEEWEVPVKVGERFSAKLLKSEKENFEISCAKMFGLMIKLIILK